MQRLAFATFSFLVLALFTGCGDGKGSVRGTVSFNDRPIKKGVIKFTSTEGPLIHEGAVITDGSFETRVPPGKYKVEVNAQHVTGKRIQKGFDGNDEEILLSEEMLPEYYNSNTELTEVVTSGENTITLRLKARP